MAGSFSDYAESRLLDHLLRNTPFVQPAGLFVGLFTTSPSDAGGGVEVSGSNYSRVAVSMAPATGTNPTVAASSIDITFPTPSASWGTVVAFALFDAISGGNMLVWGSLTISKTVSAADIVKFLAGNLQVTLD
jgi:hypothetical protein